MSGPVHTTPEELENGDLTLKMHQKFSVHTVPEELENRGFTPKAHQMFYVHTTPEEFENATITEHIGFVFQQNWAREIFWLSWNHGVRKAPFSKVFLPHKNKKQAFSNSSGLKSVFEKLRFCDGLVWTESLTVEKRKLRFKFMHHLFPLALKSPIGGVVDGDIYIYFNFK